MQLEPELCPCLLACCLPWFGARGAAGVAPTGRRVRVPFVVVVKFEGDKVGGQCVCCAARSDLPPFKLDKWHLPVAASHNGVAGGPVTVPIPGKRPHGCSSMHS